MAAPNKSSGGFEDKLSQIDARFSRFDQFKTVSSSFATLAIGHSGNAKVLRYDLNKLVKSGTFLTALCARGTVFTMDTTVGKSCAGYSLIGLGSFCLVYFYPNPEILDTIKFEGISSYLNSFIPFILSLYLALTLSRWWTMRVEGIGALMEAAQNIVMILSALCPGKDFEQFHDQILKYAMASMSLLVNSCRGITDVDFLGPKRDKLLTAEEVAIVTEVAYRPRAALMWVWIAALCIHVMEEHGIGGGKQRDAISQCVEARNGISLIWSHLGTQLPFAYVHLVTLLVNINNLLLVVKCGAVLASDLHSGDYIHGVSQALFIVIIPLLYQGLLAVSYAINNPFGDDMLDFPVMAYQEMTNEVACAISVFSCDCPAVKMTWAPNSSTKRDIALRKGLGLAEAEAVEAGISPVPDPPFLRKLAEGNANATVDEQKVREALIEESLREQLRMKDEIVQALQTQNQVIQDSLSMSNGRLQKLEARMDARRMNPQAGPLLVVPSSTSCCPAPLGAVIERGNSLPNRA